MADLISRPAASALNDACIIHVVEDPGGTPLSVKMTIAQLKTELDLYTKAEVTEVAKQQAIIFG